MPPNAADLNAAIAVTRFGLGARPGEIAFARPDPRGWLRSQVTAGPVAQPPGALTPTAQHLAGFAAVRRMRQEARATAAATPEGQPGAAPANPAAGMLRDEIVPEFMARARLGCLTGAPFAERWALFWCNHFTTAATKPVTAVLVGPFEREAIRPYAFGRFEDMLLASTRHPAMLTYLDQQQSFGPNSLAAERRGGGLNENLAREILELHTLGVGNYGQADVTELARALTGWSLVGPNEPQRPRAPIAGGQVGDFAFRDRAHEPGPRTILNRRFPEGGEEQARGVLAELARHPATARHLAEKIARHFVADAPPPTLVSTLAQAYQRSGGRLDEVARTLIATPEAWAAAAAKFKTPYEFLVSAYRAVALAPERPAEIAPVLTAMGQKPFSAPSPKGWSDEAGDWAAPDAVIKRLSWSERFASAAAPAGSDPRDWAAGALGARLTPAVATAVARAESRSEALAILLMSPEFQRR